MGLELNDDSQYKLKPTLLNALIIVAVYIIIVVIVQKILGVPYPEIAKSSSNMLYGVLIPVTTGAVILTIIALWSGWWKDVWRDKYQIKGHSWMHIFLILFVFAIIVNLITGHIGSLDTNLVLTIFIAMAFVGYAEELLTRGLLVQGARGSGLTEVKIFFIVILVFGGMHAMNFISGQGITTTIIQVIFAGLLGGVFYTIFRKTGFLVIPMIIHALWDFSVFTRGAINVNQVTTLTLNIILMAMAGFAILISFLLLIFAIRNFNVKSTKDEHI
ncbi:CPBP family intramembrane glutamic endopeptidase [Methanobacterium alcaliphilum]|uniref:CPBP family intramembrane glutamic endopeptidase n=1 Tax=Methanobacterium alcaliphilum TaxID=392018 RepID=UPI00200A0C2C|nr:CPBP family intramembrane glutamic endopeptidase [Methanobacterium alcaliphilum]MCK9150469.1 CPBP family intramembrane metalloprotease [Methanobacterium alcaliphilum]